MWSTTVAGERTPLDRQFAHRGCFCRNCLRVLRHFASYQTTIEQLSGSIASGIEKIQNKLDSMTAAQDDS